MLTIYQLKAEREFTIHICQLTRHFFTRLDQMRNITDVSYLSFLVVEGKRNRLQSETELILEYSCSGNCQTRFFTYRVAYYLTPTDSVPAHARFPFHFVVIYNDSQYINWSSNYISSFIYCHMSTSCNQSKFKRESLRNSEKNCAYGQQRFASSIVNMVNKNEMNHHYLLPILTFLPDRESVESCFVKITHKVCIDILLLL